VATEASASFLISLECRRVQTCSSRTSSWMNPSVCGCCCHFLYQSPSSCYSRVYLIPWTLPFHRQVLSVLCLIVILVWINCISVSSYNSFCLKLVVIETCGGFVLSLVYAMCAQLLRGKERDWRSLNVFFGWMLFSKEPNNDLKIENFTAK